MPPTAATFLTTDEYLHLIVGGGVRRIDLFAAKNVVSANDPRAVEYLGTSFSPKLAASIDDSGVWPAAKLSKLRHLLRTGRRRRIFHQGEVVVRCAEGVFGPTIDSLVLGDILVKLVGNASCRLSASRRVVEIGTGTGFLLCLVTAHLAGVLELAAGATCPRAQWSAPWRT